MDDSLDVVRLGNAALHAQLCASQLTLAHGIIIESGRVSAPSISRAIDSMRDAAGQLGYDLVKREPKQEAA
jgi:hypothetical protein